jgi:hypothetical protein
MLHSIWRKIRVFYYKWFNRRSDRAPWNQLTDNLEYPGDICCQRASGPKCYEHDYRNY